MCGWRVFFYIWELGCLSTGIWLCFNYYSYIDVYHETNYIPSSCYISQMAADDDLSGTLTVRYGEGWNSSLKLNHEPQLACWCLGQIEECYVDFKAIAKDTADAIDATLVLVPNSDSKYPTVTFLAPDLLYVLHWFIVISSAFIIVIPALYHLIHQLCRNYGCGNSGYYNYNYTSNNNDDEFIYPERDDFGCSFDSCQKACNCQKDIHPGWFSLVQFVCVVMVLLIMMTIWGVLLMDYKIKSLSKTYNVANYNSIVDRNDSNIINDSIIFKDSNTTQDNDIDIFLCNVSNIVDWEFRTRTISYKDSNNDDKKVKKKFTLLWLLYEVTVYKYKYSNNMHSYSDSNNYNMYTDLEVDAQDVILEWIVQNGIRPADDDDDNDYDVAVTVAVERMNFLIDYGYLERINESKLAMESFVVHEISDDYANYTDFDYMKVGNIDFCYKTEGLNNQYQFNDPSNEYVEKMNDSYGETLAIIGGIMGGIFCFGALSMCTKTADCCREYCPCCVVCIVAIETVCMICAPICECLAFVLQIFAICGGR